MRNLPHRNSFGFSISLLARCGSCRTYMIEHRPCKLRNNLRRSAFVTRNLFVDASSSPRVIQRICDLSHCLFGATGGIRTGLSPDANIADALPMRRTQSRTRRLDPDQQSTKRIISWPFSLCRPNPSRARTPTISTVCGKSRSIDLGLVRPL
jgi:hypothetical protein